MPKITAVAISTGRKQIIPDWWIDHPVLGTDFKRPPSARKGKKSSPARPVDSVEPVEQAGSEPVSDETPENGDKE